MTFRLRLHGAVAGATACTALLAGCGTSGAYYMVREPGSTTPYYTTSISTSGSAVKFKDAKTGSGVTLQSSEVRKISKEEYAQAMTPPAPAAVIVPLPTSAGTGASAPAAVAIPATPSEAKPQ